MSDAPYEPTALVRPYALTRGRTRPSRAYPVAELCRESRSVAEVAALVRLPLGVANVLVGDLVDRGVVRVHTTTTPDAAPDSSLLQRVLTGLRKL